MDVTIVIPNYNTPLVTADCVESIIKHTKKNSFKIVIVDNASIDDSVSSLTKRFKGNNNVAVIASNTNGGYAYAINLGLKQANSKYFLVLNSDTLFTEDILSKATGFLENNPNVGIVGCTLLGSDGKIQPSGGYFPTLFRVFSLFFLQDLLGDFGKMFHPRVTNNIYKHNSDLDWITGAFVLVRSELFRKLHGFDEKYFMYGEEVDFCYRAKQQGNSVRYLSDVYIKHLGQISGGTSWVWGEIRGLRLFYKKFYSTIDQILLRPILFLGLLSRLIPFMFLKKNLVKPYLKALSYV